MFVRRYFFIEWIKIWHLKHLLLRLSDFIEAEDIHWLYFIFETFDTLLQVINWNLFVFDDTPNDNLVYSVGNWFLLVFSFPNETVLWNSDDLLGELVKVSFSFVWLYFEEDKWLGDGTLFLGGSFFGSFLWGFKSSFFFLNLRIKNCFLLNIKLTAVGSSSPKRSISSSSAGFFSYCFCASCFPGLPPFPAACAPPHWALTASVNLLTRTNQA